MPSATRKRSKSRPPVTSKPLQFIGREPSASIFPSKADLLRLFAVVAIAASVAAACNYAVYLLNRQDKPFCDSIEGSYDSENGLCEPCPYHGWCSSGSLECVNGYKKQGRKCIEDGVINQTTKKALDLLEEHVCKAYGQILCNLPGKIWFQEAEIKDIIEDHITWSSIDLKADTSKFIKDMVMEAVESVLETKAANNRSKEYKCPDMLAEFRKPLRCRMNQWIYKHAGILLAIFGLVRDSLGFYINFLVESDSLMNLQLVGLAKFTLNVYEKRNLTQRAEQLYEQVCEILQENAMRAMSGENKGERWVVASWLRDQLLLPRERKHSILWKKVEELIMEDSRIDRYPKLIKGESKVVLEWQVDGPLASMLKEKESASKAKAFSGDKGSIGSYRNKEKKYEVAEHLFS